MRRFIHTVAVGLRPESLGRAAWARLRRTTARLDIAKGTAGMRDSVGHADCLLVDLGTAVEARLLDAAPRLRYIGVLGTAFDGIDRGAAARRGVAVCNVPGYSTDAVSEFTFAAVLATLRGLDADGGRVRSGEVSEPPSLGRQLRGRTIGVLGMGRIGQRVAETAMAGFQAEVRYWSRTRKSSIEAAGASYRQVEDVLSCSDVISLNLALNRETAGFLGARRLRLLRPGAVLVNFAPMGLIALDPLVRRLRAGAFTFLMDHADGVPPQILRQLLRLDACRVYPPIGYRTVEALDEARAIFVGNVEAFLRGAPRNLVTPPKGARRPGPRPQG